MTGAQKTVVAVAALIVGALLLFAFGVNKRVEPGIYPGVSAEWCIENGGQMIIERTEGHYDFNGGWHPGYDGLCGIP